MAQQFSIMNEATNWIGFSHWCILGFSAYLPLSQACYSFDKNIFSLSQMKGNFYKLILPLAIV